MCSPSVVFAAPRFQPLTRCAGGCAAGQSPVLTNARSKRRTDRFAQRRTIGFGSYSRLRMPSHVCRNGLARWAADSVNSVADSGYLLM